MSVIPAKVEILRNRVHPLRLAFEELTKYSDINVQWKTLQTPYGNHKGKGVWRLVSVSNLLRDG